jgi:hypothetical protein
MPNANITFRTHLVGGVDEFCTNSNLPLLNKNLHLVELVVLLARYQEEGVSLCPEVYITNNIDEVCMMLPESELVKIGKTNPNPDGIKQILKKCAPLAFDGWLIYIQDNTNTVEYGVFKGSSNPISVMVDDILMDKNIDFAIVKACQIAHDCVEIRCNNGSYHYIFLNHRKEDSPPPLQYLDKLVSAITENSSVDEQEPTFGLLKKLLFEALRQSHGCIIAVTHLSNAPSFLSEDGIILEQAIDFPNMVKALKKFEIPPSQLESKGKLLNGMLNSDGIIIFNNSGKLLGYNCFVKITQNENIIGGARKRAFSALKEKIGNELTAVFIQSQDGWSDFKGNSND